MYEEKFGLDFIELVYVIKFRLFGDVYMLCALDRFMIALLETRSKGLDGFFYCLPR